MNRIVRSAFAVAFLLFLLVVPVGSVRAAPVVRIDGTIVAVSADKRSWLIRCEASAAMPAMTMRFTWADAPGVRPGDRFQGTADAAGDPRRIRSGRVRRPLARTAVPRYVPELAVGDVVPSVVVRDQDDRTVSWSTWRGSTTVVGFIYTRCRDSAICPLVSAKFASMQRALRGTPIHLVEITLDPAYDVPTVLRRYAAAFNADPARWSLLTGDPRAVEELVQRFGIVQSGDPNVALAHSEGLVIVGPDGSVTDRIDGNSWSPGEIVAQARRRASMRGNVVARARLALAQGVGAMCGTGASGISLGVTLLIFGALLGVGTLVARRIAASR